MMYSFPLLRFLFLAVFYSLCGLINYDEKIHEKQGHCVLVHRNLVNYQKQSFSQILSIHVNVHVRCMVLCGFVYPVVYTHTRTNRERNNTDRGRRESPDCLTFKGRISWSECNTL